MKYRESGIKKTQCPKCSGENQVPVTQTKIKCEKCGFEYIVYNTNSVRSTT